MIMIRFKTVFTITIILFTVLLIISTGCKKEEIDPGYDFIEFAIDEEENVFRLEANPGGSNISSGNYLAIPEIPVYQFNFDFTAKDNNQNKQAMLIIKSNNPFLTGPYPLAGNTQHGMLYFPSFIFSPNVQNEYSLSDVSGGNISLTRMGGTERGSKIEGTFNFSRVQLKDNNNNIISSEHTVTQGRFRITLE